MKKFVFACLLAIGGLTTSLVAQDFCCPQFDTCCDNSFSGIYVGGNVGVLGHTAHRNDIDGFLTDNSGWTHIEQSVIGGVQVGYDWQCGNRLVGIVGDWNWANPDHRLRDNPNGGGLGGVHSEHRWLATIRARAGVTVCDALFYLTLGGAVSRFQNTWDLAPNLFSVHHHRWGWVGGVGTEFMLGCNLSVGGELLYVQFNEHERTFSTGGTTPTLFTFGHSDELWIGRLLVNYRFRDLF